MPGLTPEEIDTLLAGPITARLATVREDGTPYIVPIWQRWEGGAIYLVARERAAFIPHLRNQPRVAVSCADDVEFAHPRVLIEGPATIVEGPVVMSGRMLEIAREMALRYGGERGVGYLEGTLDRPRYLIRVDAEKMTSWRGPWHPRYL